MKPKYLRKNQSHDPSQHHLDQLPDHKPDKPVQQEAAVSESDIEAPEVIQIDPETGEIKWHFQTTPREGWDYDGVNEVVAYTDADGNPVPNPVDSDDYEGLVPVYWA